MPIVIASPLQNISPWTKAINSLDDTIQVLAHEEVQNKEKIEFILAWNQPEGLFAQYPNLKTISSMGAGVDHLIRANDIAPQVQIVRIIDPLLSQDMFEFVLAIIMNRLRMLTFYYENQKQKVWKKKLYQRISDVRIGIMGTGKIGSHVAGKLAAMGFSVSGWGRSGENAPAGLRKFHGNVQLEAFLSGCNMLISLLPLTSETRGILNKTNLKILPQGAWLINIGRGGLVVDKDLVQLLDEDHLDGASLDVFHEEPLPNDHPFWSHPKIHITPHIASLTHPGSVAGQIVENYYRTINNQPLINLVNRDLEY